MKGFKMERIRTRGRVPIMTDDAPEKPANDGGSTGTRAVSPFDRLNLRRTAAAGTVAPVIKRVMHADGDVCRSESPINGSDGSASIYLYEAGGKICAGKYYNVGDDNIDSVNSQNGDAQSPASRSLASELNAYQRIGHHKYIAEAFEVATDTIDGAYRPVLLLEFIDGINGDEVRRGLQAGLKNGHLSYGEFCAIEAAICHDKLEAIKHWSKVSLVHGDLKPQNTVTVASTGDTKVIDFGLAMAAGKAGLGSPFYKAPEQFANEGELKRHTSEKTPVGKDTDAPAGKASASSILGENKTRSKRTTVGEDTDVFAVGASALAVIEGDEEGCLRAFEKLRVYLEKMGGDNESRPLKNAVFSLELFLSQLFVQLKAIGEEIQPSSQQAAALSRLVEGECRTWLRGYTKQVFHIEGMDDAAKLGALADESQALSDFVASVHKILAGPKERRREALSSQLFFISRAPNTGISIDKEIRKDSFGNVVRDRGVLALETDFTRFIDMAMKSRCTADQALSMPFIKDSVGGEARAKELLKMVVEKTRDGSIFRPKVGGNASRSAPSKRSETPTSETAGRDTEQFKSNVENGAGAGFSFEARREILAGRLSRRWTGWGPGVVRYRAASYELLGSSKNGATKNKSSVKRSLKTK
jgi:serine/threonine protein kinase